jgi:hypothetical protein
MIIEDIKCPSKKTLENKPASHSQREWLFIIHHRESDKYIAASSFSSPLFIWHR